MEFVSPEEVAELFDEYGIEQVPEGEDRIYLRMTNAEGVVHVHLATKDTACKPMKGASMVRLEKPRLPKVIEHVMHLLDLHQVLLVPVGKWRKVFDAVAFSLAGNEHWQEVDASATVELNTRDPLLCEPSDVPLLVSLITALMQDADSPDQGLNFIATGSPVLVEIVPDGAVRISLGSQVLADEVAEAFAQ